MIRASDYGRALFELARQEHREGEIGEEMAGVRAILEQQPAYALARISKDVLSYQKRKAEVVWERTRSGEKGFQDF